MYTVLCEICKSYFSNCWEVNFHRRKYFHCHSPMDTKNDRLYASVTARKRDVSNINLLLAYILHSATLWWCRWPSLNLAARRWIFVKPDTTKLANADRSHISNSCHMGRGVPDPYKHPTWVTVPNLIKRCWSKGIRAYVWTSAGKTVPLASRFSRWLKIIGADTDRSGTRDFLLIFHITLGLSYTFIARGIGRKLNIRIG